MAKWTTCIVGRGTSSKRGDGGRSLVPMTPEGTSRGSVEASVTPAVKLGSAAIISLVVGSATPALIVDESAKRGILLRGPPARGPCHGNDRWPTESTLQRKVNHRTYCPPVRWFAHAQGRSRTIDTQPLRHARIAAPALGDASLLRIPKYSRPRSEIPLERLS